MNLNDRRQLVSQMITVVVTLTFVVAMVQYPDFFFFPPFSAYTWWLSLEQLLFSVAWVVFLLVPAVNAFTLKRHFIPRWVVVFGFTLWPSALFLIHASLWVATGNPYLDYLWQHPIFIFTDIVSPVLYLGVHMKNTSRH